MASSSAGVSSGGEALELLGSAYSGLVATVAVNLLVLKNISRFLGRPHGL